MPDRLSTLKHEAEWAEFSAPTNLAQRQRAERDKEAYATALVEQQQQQLLDTIGKDQTAQNLFFRSKELGMKRELHADKLRKAEELHPLKLRSEQALERQRNAQAERTLKENALNSEIESGRHAFLAARADLLLSNPELTDEQLEDKDVELAKRFPFAMRSPETKEIIETSRAGFSKRAAAKQAAETAEASGMVPKSVTSSGVSYGPDKPEDTPKNDNQKRIDDLKDEYAKSYATRPDKKDKPDPGREAMLKRINELESQKPNPASSEAGVPSARVEGAPAKAAPATRPSRTVGGVTKYWNGSSWEG